MNKIIIGFAVGLTLGFMIGFFAFKDDCKQEPTTAKAQEKTAKNQEQFLTWG